MEVRGDRLETPVPSQRARSEAVFRELEEAVRLLGAPARESLRKNSLLLPGA